MAFIPPYWILWKRLLGGTVFMRYYNSAASWENRPSDIYASSKASGEPAHRRSLVRSFAVYLNIYQGLLFIKSKQQSFWRDCADAQAPLKLCCLHMSEGPFSYDAPHLGYARVFSQARLSFPRAIQQKYYMGLKCRFPLLAYRIWKSAF